MASETTTPTNARTSSSCCQFSNAPCRGSLEYNSPHKSRWHVVRENAEGYSERDGVCAECRNKGYEYLVRVLFPMFKFPNFKYIHTPVANMLPKVIRFLCPFGCCCYVCGFSLPGYRVSWESLLTTDFCYHRESKGSSCVHSTTFVRAQSQFSWRRLVAATEERPGYKFFQYPSREV